MLLFGIVVSKSRLKFQLQSTYIGRGDPRMSSAGPLANSSTTSAGNGSAHATNTRKRIALPQIPKYGLQFT